MVNKTTNKTAGTKTTGRTTKAKASTIDWLSAASETNPAFITLDNQQRLYFNATTRQICGKGRAFYVGYDAGKKSLIVMPAAQGAISADVKPFKLDGRSYAKAQALVDRLRINVSSLPLHYDYVGEREVDGETAYEFILRKA